MNKSYSQQLFTIALIADPAVTTYPDLDLTVVCETQNTRNGFRHLATVPYQVGSTRLITAKVNYINRTWERFQYETVLDRIGDALLEEYAPRYSSFKVTPR